MGAAQYSNNSSEFRDPSEIGKENFEVCNLKSDPSMDGFNDSLVESVESKSVENEENGSSCDDSGDQASSSPQVIGRLNSKTLASADGKPLEELGKAIFEVELGDLKFKELIVEAIEEDALLGQEVLMKEDCGYANLRLCNGIMLLGDTPIPYRQIDQPERVRKIGVTDRFILSAQSDKLNDVFEDRFENDDNLDSLGFVLESTTDIIQRYPVMMAPTVVSIQKDVTDMHVARKIKQFKLYQNTVHGKAELLTTKPEVLVSCGDIVELKNFCPVSHMKVERYTKLIKWETNTGIIRSKSKKGTSDGGKSGIVSV